MITSSVAPSIRWRVLHVAEAWNGGVGVYLGALMRLQLEDPRFEEVHVACSSTRTPARLSLEGHPKLRVHRYASSRSALRVRRVARAVHDIIGEVKPDLIHLHSTFAGVYGRFFPCDCPVVYCAHGWAFTQEVAPAVKWAYAQVERLLARRTHMAVHISHDELRAARSYGVRASEDRVILHGVREPARLPQRLVLDPERIHLGFVGRFDRQKGTELLLQSFAKVARQDIHLYLVGDFDREVRRSQSTAPVDPRITRLGWVSQEELDGVLSGFDAVVIPSRWEGFGLVAAEAMRNGKPVIVSHRGGLPEQVVHGFNGFVFPFEEPRVLTDLLEKLDKNSLSRMGANARQVWESSFSESRAYEELMQAYGTLLVDRLTARGFRG